VQEQDSYIAFEDIRLLGLGRLTALVHSTEARPGILLGSRKGLYHLADPGSRAKRLRRHPIGNILSGEKGVVCYEEIRGKGRLSILDENLGEVRVDTELARSVNPVACWNAGLILFNRDVFEYLDLRDGRRSTLAPFEPIRTLSQFARTGGNFEFIAVHKGPKWPTRLYSLAPSVVGGPEAEVKVKAQAEDPILTRIFLLLGKGAYLAVPQGQPIFSILRVYPGEPDMIRQWALIPIPGEAHPVGLILLKDRLYAACSDSLLKFRVSGDISGPM
jgi:hypothetical protein